MVRRALVLGAGGHAASAWETGVLLGLGDEGVDVRAADVVVGTSAGARVAVGLLGNLSLEELHARELAPAHGLEHALPSDIKRWRASFAEARQGAADEKDALRRLGALGPEATTSADARGVALASVVATGSWPDRELRIVAVDAASGERRVFERASGVSLLDAVGASGAMPGLFPLVAIGGRKYMDGGVYSVDNADVAIDCDVVLVLTLRAKEPPISVVSLERGVESLRKSGRQVEVILPDEATEAAFAAVGGNVLDPEVRPGALRAGRDQGRALARTVGRFWRGASCEAGPPVMSSLR